MLSVFKIHDGTVWVTSGYLSTHGISLKSIKSRLNEHRKGKTKNWQNIPHPEDKRIKLIQYSSIPSNTRSHYKLPTEHELKAKYAIEQQLTTAKEAHQREKLKLEQYKVAILKRIENSLSDFYPELMDVVSHKNDAYIIMNCKRFAAYRACIDLQSEGAKHSHVLTAYNEIQSNDPDLVYYSRTDTLGKKLNSIKLRGVHGLLDGKINRKSNNTKLTKRHEEMIIMMYGQQMKPTIPQVKIELDAKCKSQGLELISESAIASFISRPEINNLVASMREGKAIDKPYVPGAEIKFAGSKHVIDGTAIQFIAKTDEGREIRLYMTPMMDAASEKITGYDISRTETRLSVKRTYQRSFENTGYLPAETVSDNSSAMKSTEVRSLLEGYEKLGVKVRYAKVGNAQDKEIEQFFRTFHAYCRAVPGWLGSNVPAPDRNYKPSKEFLAYTYKKNGVPNEDTLKALIVQLIHQYNNDSLNGRMAPTEKHNRSEKPHVIYPKPEEAAFLFLTGDTYTVRNSMIIRIVGAKKFHYKIWDHEDKLRLNNHKVLVKFDDDMNEAWVYNATTNRFECTCKLMPTPSRAQAEQTDEDRQEMIKQAAHNDSYERFIRDKQIEIHESYKENTGEDFTYTGAFELRKQDVLNKDLAEYKYYMRELGIDPTKVDEEFGKPIITGAWVEKNGKDYTNGKYNRKGSLKAIKDKTESETTVG